jgi:hypothetical protein
MGDLHCASNTGVQIASRSLMPEQLRVVVHVAAIMTFYVFQAYTNLTPYDLRHMQAKKNRTTNQQKRPYAISSIPAYQCPLPDPRQEAVVGNKACLMNQRTIVASWTQSLQAPVNEHSASAPP